MGYKGRGNIRVVGWIASLVMFCGLFIIWKGDQSWLQNESILQFCNTNEKNLNVSMAVEEGQHGKNVNVSMAVEEGQHGENVNVSMAVEEDRHGKNVNVSMAVKVNVSTAVEENVSMAVEEGHQEKNVNVSMAVEEGPHGKNVNVSMAVAEGHQGKNNDASQHNGDGQCNLFTGKWVFDDSYVLYVDGSCPFASADFNCRKNGRVDSSYERWRWQPYDCDLPRFDVSLMLEKLRGKRLVYVGDSINRNQWESMLCLLRVVVPYDGGNVETKDDGLFLKYFVKGYNCSIEFSWAPFLVQQKSNNGKETLGIDMISQQSHRWRDADILVFNSWHWWTHQQPRAGINYFEEGGQVIPYMEEHAALQ